MGDMDPLREGATPPASTPSTPPTSAVRRGASAPVRHHPSFTPLTPTFKYLNSAVYERSYILTFMQFIFFT